LYVLFCFLNFRSIIFGLFPANIDVGGLSTSFKQLKANLLLSAVAAFTGVATPVALSFLLMRLVDSTPLQAFGAGAALCSTSIGTTFTILSTTGLDKSRLGTVLSGAAMMDDVAGLVMVQIISNLGSSTTGSFSAVTVVRPICVAVGFAIGIVLVCGLAVKPAVRKLRGMNISLLRKGKKTQVAFALHMATLIGFVTGASYAGTSGLFAAYLAGACISWFDDLHISTEQSSYQGVNPIGEASGASQSPIEMSPQGPSSNIPSQTTPQGNGALGSDSSTSFVSEDKPRMASGQQTFTAYCKQPLQFILCPFFFVSFFITENLLPLDNALTEIGVDRVCDSDNTDVPRPNCLARYCVHLTNGTCKNCHWYLAATDYDQPGIWPSETQKRGSNPDYLVHIKSQAGGP
jgi:hypothetical protein